MSDFGENAGISVVARSLSEHAAAVSTPAIQSALRTCADRIDELEAILTERGWDAALRALANISDPERFVREAKAREVLCRHYLQTVSVDRHMKEGDKEIARRAVDWTEDEHG